MNLQKVGRENVMTLKQTIEIYELLDSAIVSGEQVAKWLMSQGETRVTVTTVQGEKGSTDFVRITIPGLQGKVAGGSAPTLGVIGRLGGIGARPERIGLVSDADGAIVALAVAAKAIRMQANGDSLPGDLIVCTHICPTAPTVPHYPVPFMSSPVDMATMNRHEVHPDMDAVLSIDTTKGNKILNHRGVAITPTVKEGYILPVANDLVDLLQYTTGQRALVLPLSTYDITPYGNNLHHLNSIMQPATAIKSPVVGVAITAEIPVPGCATGASHIFDLEAAGRFCLEVAKGYGAGTVSFYDEKQYSHALKLYGSMERMQGKG
jgi:hypothetical protein